jgi:hypothetical protein
MSYSDLKKLKKEEVKETSKVETKFLIVGGDLFSLATYDFLASSYNSEEIKILTKENISKQTTSFAGPGVLRGESNISFIEEFYDYAEVKRNEKVSCFYKDLKFKPFGGRSKSEKLLWGEEFYTSPKADYNVESIFPFLKDDSFFESVNAAQMDNIPSRIFKDEDKWVVECTNGTQIYCEELFWCESPWKFYDDFKEKEKLSNEFIEYIEGVKTPCALHIKLIFDGSVTDMEETIFIPLSYTHEWGHFISEFSPYNDETKTQTSNFLTFIDINHTNEEDISKKIRLLKRNLEKIFPHLKNISYKEFIVLTENTHSLNFDDSFSLEGQESLEHVHFVNSNAPFSSSFYEEGSDGDSMEALSHVARGLKVLSQVKSSLSKKSKSEVI